MVGKNHYWSFELFWFLLTHTEGSVYVTNTWHMIVCNQSTFNFAQD